MNSKALVLKKDYKVFSKELKFLGMNFSSLQSTQQLLLLAWLWWRNHGNLQWIRLQRIHCNPYQKERFHHWRICTGTVWVKLKQDGRLAPAYFSPNYKYFDQFFQKAINKTTVLILVFKEFLKHQFDHWFLYFMQKGITIFCLKFSVSQCRKTS